jgi:hypothetical protein
MAIACAAALPLCALLLVLAVDARVLLLLFLLLALLALAIVNLAMPVLAILTKFLLCAFILVAMLARIQVYSCKIPWLDYSVQFLHICKCQCQCLWAGSLCSNSLVCSTEHDGWLDNFTLLIMCYWIQLQNCLDDYL